MGLWIYDRALKKQGRGENEKWADAVYVRENAQARLRIEKARQAAVLWLCIVAADMAGIAVLLVPDHAEEAAVLSRPEFGQEIRYSLEVEGIDDKTREITVEVDGQEPDEDGMNAVFEEARLSLTGEMLGNNSSAEEVNEDLRLPSSTLYGIRVVWKSLSPEWISDSGKLTDREVPAEGVAAALEASMSYSMYEYRCQINIRIVPKRKDAAWYTEALKGMIRDRNDRNRSDAYIELPSGIDEKMFTYRISKNDPFLIVPFLFVLCGILFVVFQKEILREKYNIRTRQLEQDYSDLVFELGIMLQCGMNVRGAWSRITAEYEKERTRNRPERYLYEEMIVTGNQIAAGVSEASAYTEFGKRCGVHSYIRLGNALERNLAQGISGMCDMLDQELMRAMDNRKNEALKEGERIAAKMLIPMFILLCLVIAVLMIPAFMSM